MARTKSPTIVEGTHCPECAAKGKKVKRITLESLLAPDAAPRIGDAQYRFCDSIDCKTVYFGDDGKIPLLAAVKTAEKARLETQPARGYQPIEGIPAYNNAVQGLLFGKDSTLLAAGRAITCECLGGTGALKVGADYLKRLLPEAKVYISDPSWENHRALFE